MKKLLCIGVALTLLSACSTFEPDLDKAAEERAENRAEIRNEIGCQFANDHDAYRRCLISTYENNKPKTFTTAQDCSGQPVVVVSSGKTQGMVYADGVITQAGSTQTTATTQTTTTTQVPVHQLSAVPCGTQAGDCFYTTQALYEAQVAPCTTCAPKQVVVEQPKIVTVEQTETIEEKPVEVVPAPQPLPDKTWWETYQEEKQPVKPTVVCPCPDPNDPCPQCVTK